MSSSYKHKRWGTLNVVSDDREAVEVGKITFSDITLEASGKYGIAGSDTGEGKLILKNAKVTAKGTEGAIVKLYYLVTEGCEIIYPVGGKFDKEKHAVVDANGNIANEVRIVPIKSYDLVIAGARVTHANCGDLSKLDGVTVAEGGEFKYDPDTKTLTMKDVTVSVGDDKNAIENKGVEGLEIKISGTNQLESTNYSSLYCGVTTNISGEGTLTTVSTGSAGVCANRTTLTISDITLKASGKWGIGGQDGTQNEKLILKNAKVTATGTEAGIADLALCTIENCKMVAPVDGKFDEEQHAVVDAQGNVAKEVKIEPFVKYALYIAGTQVTELNYNALKDIDGVTVAEGGEFKYDPNSNTLTMKDVTVSGVISTSVAGLRIIVSGANRLESKAWGTFASGAATFIEGNGSLTITNSSASSILVAESTLTISDITVEASGKLYGIVGFSGKGEHLVLNNTKLTAKSDDNGAIKGFESLTLDACKIVAPVGGKFNETEHAVVNAEGKDAKEVKIERVDPVAVTGVRVTPTTVDLKVKETQQLTVTVEPDKATNKRYTCQSNNEGVATVDSKGLVTAVGVGTATITITTEDGGKTAQCTVNVTEGGTPSFALSQTTLNVPAAGGTPSVDVTSDKAWTLDYDSSVTWLKTPTKGGAGSQAVTFTVEKNEGTAPRSVVVTFKQAETEKELQLTITQETTASAHVLLQGISFEEANMKIKVETSATLVVKYNPENATNKKVTWEVTEGAASLSVDANSGTITATNVEGTAKVKATSEDGGHTAECTITVTTEDIPVESISVLPALLNLTVEGTEKLSVLVKPMTATNQTATWAVTSGADIVSVDGTGLVRALKEGTATVTATVAGKTATCTVNVKAKDAPTTPEAIEDAVLASVVVAPNPFTSQLRIVNPEGLALRYELVTLTGNVVCAGALDGTETVVDTEALPAGLYFVRFRTANSSERSVKVVKY
ncbi:MAG: Ig-like domain-containing protein [Bacteroides sp.]